MDVIYIGEFNGRQLYSRSKLDYRLRLWAPTSASRAISAVAKLLVLGPTLLSINKTMTCPMENLKSNFTAS